jgi:2-methylcitrate dehydratase PrpD
MKIPHGSAAERFADYIVREKFASLPADVITKAMLCFQDSIGCYLGACVTPVARIMAGFSADVAGSDARQIAPWPNRDCGTAALVYATLINALDYDDIYKKGHPGATVMSAALALAERVDRSGPDLIEAVVVGYEVSGRVGMSLTQSTPRKTLHGHGTWQTMGAAATAAKLLRLDVRQAAHAIAIAAANAPVASVMKTVYAARPSMAKNNFGAAAQVGVNAALLARRGFEGPLDIFEGETGFWRMFGADACDSHRLVEGLGKLYEIREVGFKPYSCCRILQSSVEAAVELFRRAEIDPRSSGYQGILVSTPAIVCDAPFNNPRPHDMWSAQFSAPYTIALALLGVEPGPGWFTQERLADPELSALAARIELRPYIGGNGAKPAHHAASAEIKLEDGRVLKAEIGVARGEAANPLSQAVLDRKFLHVATGSVGSDVSNRALNSIKSIENARSVRPLLAEISMDRYLQTIQPAEAKAHDPHVTA